MRNLKIFAFCVYFVLSCFLPFALFAGTFDDVMGNDIDANADSLKFVGDNVIASGDVLIRYGEYIVRADKAIVNLSSKDVEAVGNVSFVRRNENKEEINLITYREYCNQGYKRVRIDGYVTDATGEQKLDVTIFENGDVFKAKKAVGNLSTGALEFEGFKAKTKEYYIDGKYASRNPDGIIEVTDAKISTCEYMLEDNEHYSVTAGKLKIYPYRETVAKGLGKYNMDTGDHSMWAYNCTMRLGKIPVAWFPVFYKPKDENWGWLKIQTGDSSEFGYTLKLSKKFQLLDYPNTSSEFFLDLFTKRGIGLGNETTVSTEKSYTDFFAYGIRDSHPYGATSDDREYEDERAETDRLTIPHNRYDLRLSNLTHITPRMDFRGHIEKLSDINFLHDFFEDRYYEDPQPVSFGSLEYQFDRFTAALYVRPRVNNFFSTVERLPEFRIDVPRQELFHNIYYQGQTSVDNFKMRWRDYDNPRTTGNGVDPSNYSSFRFDTLHMFYYPFKLDWLNIIPRAGIRLTMYSKSSKNSISTDDLGTMFIVDSPDGHPAGNVVNYDVKNRWKFRVTGEIGVQMNTKIYRSWNNVKNAFWKLDGLRHVMVPYINYTFIPKPTVDRNHILYFDDVDRIEEQNFIRFGLKNRLQTRRGDYGEEEIYNWLSLENYIDYHFQKKDGFKHLGDLGTILEFTPFEGFSFRSELLLDLAQNSDHDTDSTRAGRNAGRPGLNWKFINKWESSISYQIMEDWRIYAAYNYQDAYKERPAYSMGSTLTDIDSTSGFFRGHTSRNQTLRLGMEFPIPIDDKTKGKCEIYYDFEQGYIREMSASLTRRLHCWEVAVEVAQEIDRDYVGDKQQKRSVMFTLSLVALPSVKVGQKANMGGGSGS